MVHFGIRGIGCKRAAKPKSQVITTGKRGLLIEFWMMETQSNFVRRLLLAILKARAAATEKTNLYDCC